MEETLKTVILNIEQLITVDTTSGIGPLRGNSMRSLGIIEDAGLIIAGDKILEYGTTESIRAKTRVDEATQTIDATGKIVTPGLIDCHTHAVFASSRENEYIKRIEGATYMEIAAEGGGINSTVRAVRAASKEELVTNGKKHLDQMLKLGTTTVEIKSGYGLDLENELKMLEAIKDLGKTHEIDIVSTFLGAHEIPPEYKGQKDVYLKLLIETMLPAVKDKGLSNFCDVFCEAGVFSVEDSRKLLTKATNLGFNIRLHADEFKPIGGTELAVELGATSADHLLAISDTGIEAIAHSDTIATMLPGTSLFLDTGSYAPARKIIDAGGAVAIGSDFNPGSSPSLSLPLMLALSCIKMKMYPAETITATTLNAATVLKIDETHGSITPGKYADIVIWNLDNYKKIPYFYGNPVIDTVFKKGRVVYEKD